jgi:hypothetical protein
LNDKEIFILLLWHALELLCCVCSYKFKVFAWWIDRKYKYNLAWDNVLHRWKYRQTVHYIQVYEQNVSIGIFQWLWEPFPFCLTLFMVFITYRYTNGMCSSIYSSDYKNYSLLNALIIKILLTVHFFSNSITDRTKSHL